MAFRPRCYFTMFNAKVIEPVLQWLSQHASTTLSRAERLAPNYICHSKQLIMRGKNQAKLRKARRREDRKQPIGAQGFVWSASHLAIFVCHCNASEAVPAPAADAKAERIEQALAPAWILCARDLPGSKRAIEWLSRSLTRLGSALFFSIAQGAKFSEKWDLCYAFIKHGSCKDKNCQWRQVKQIEQVQRESVGFLVLVANQHGRGMSYPRNRSQKLTRKREKREKRERVKRRQSPPSSALSQALAEPARLCNTFEKSAVN